MSLQTFTVTVAHHDAATAELVATAVRRVVQSLALNTTDTRGAAVVAGPINAGPTTRPVHPFTLPPPRSTTP